MADNQANLYEIAFKAPAEDLGVILESVQSLETDTYARILLQLEPGIYTLTPQNLSNTINSLIYGSGNNEVLRNRVKAMAIVIREQKPADSQAIFNEIMGHHPLDVAQLGIRAEAEIKHEERVGICKIHSILEFQNAAAEAIRNQGKSSETPEIAFARKVGERMNELRPAMEKALQVQAILNSSSPRPKRTLGYTGTIVLPAREATPK